MVIAYVLSNLENLKNIAYSIFKILEIYFFKYFKILKFNDLGMKKKKKSLISNVFSDSAVYLKGT